MDTETSKHLTNVPAAYTINATPLVNLLLDYCKSQIGLLRKKQILKAQ